MRWLRREEESQRLTRHADESLRREAAERETRDHEDRTAIASSLRRLLVHLRAQEKRRKAQKSRLCSANSVRAWLVAVAAVGALIYAARQWAVMKGQLAEMQQESRAWIAPFVAGGAEPTDKNFKFAVMFGNTGHEPATNVRYAIRGVPADTLDAAEKPAVDFITSCENGQQKMTDFGASYPSSGPVYALNSNFVPEFVESNRSPVIAGCFLYRTQNVDHHSTFCFYWSADKGPLSTWFFCPFGNNSAD